MLSCTRSLRAVPATTRGFASTVALTAAIVSFVSILAPSTVIAAIIPERALIANPLPELIYEQDATTGVIAVLGAEMGNRVHTIHVPFGIDATSGGGVTFDSSGNLYAAYTYFIDSGPGLTDASATAVFAGPRPWMGATGSAFSAGYGAGENFLSVTPAASVATVALPFRLGIAVIDIQVPMGRQLVGVGNGVSSLAYLSDGTLLFSTVLSSGQPSLASIAPGATSFQTVEATGSPGVIATDGNDDVFIYSQSSATQGTVMELHFPGAVEVANFALLQSAGASAIAVSRSGRRLYLVEPGTGGTTTLGYDLATGGGEPILNHYEPNFIGRYIAIRL